MGYQAPTQQVQDILLGGGTADDRNIGSRGDVVARGKVGALGQVEEPGYFLGASGKSKATAHGVICEEDTFKKLAPLN